LKKRDIVSFIFLSPTVFTDKKEFVDDILLNPSKEMKPKKSDLANVL